LTVATGSTGELVKPASSAIRRLGLVAWVWVEWQQQPATLDGFGVRWWSLPKKAPIRTNSVRETRTRTIEGRVISSTYPQFFGDMSIRLSREFSDRE
jgi:hypothetical protein